MNEIEKIDYIHSAIKETLEAIKNDADNISLELGNIALAKNNKLKNALDLLKDLREPYLIAIKNKINSGQF